MIDYAVNVADLTTLDDITLWLFTPVIQGKKTIVAEPNRIDGSAVILECNEERATSIIHVVRLKNKIRFYKRTKTKWVKVK